MLFLTPPLKTAFVQGLVFRRAVNLCTPEATARRRRGSPLPLCPLFRLFFSAGHVGGITFPWGNYFWERSGNSLGIYLSGGTAQVLL